MHGPSRSGRSQARSAGQCRRPLGVAAPNPGSPDTSYGLAGARDWRSCVRPHSSVRAKNRRQKRPACKAWDRPIFESPRTSPKILREKSSKIWRLPALCWASTGGPVPGARRPSAVCTVKGGGGGLYSLEILPRRKKKEKKERDGKRASERRSGRPRWSRCSSTPVNHLKTLGKKGNLRVASF